MAMKICNNCNAEVNEDVKFCPYCGNSIETDDFKSENGFEKKRSLRRSLPQRNTPVSPAAAPVPVAPVENITAPVSPEPELGQAESETVETVEPEVVNSEEKQGSSGCFGCMGFLLLIIISSALFGIVGFLIALGIALYSQKGK